MQQIVLAPKRDSESSLFGLKVRAPWNHLLLLRARIAQKSPHHTSEDTGFPAVAETEGTHSAREYSRKPYEHCQRQRKLVQKLHLGTEKFYSGYSF